jgi:hypothetical protein
MGTVFRKTVTRALPPRAETIVRKGERFARWKDKHGKTRTALLTAGKDGRDRITVQSPYYVAKYRDGGNVVRVVPTGCRDETAARQVLAELERKAELVRAGVMTSQEAEVGRHHATPPPTPAAPSTTSARPRSRNAACRRIAPAPPAAASSTEVPGRWRSRTARCSATWPQAGQTSTAWAP